MKHVSFFKLLLCSALYQRKPQENNSKSYSQSPTAAYIEAQKNKERNEKSQRNKYKLRNHEIYIKKLHLFFHLTLLNLQFL